MEKLFKFFTNNSPFFVWLILTFVSIILLCHSNPYHRSYWYSSCNGLFASIFEWRSSVVNYFGLSAINENLMLKVGSLETENAFLRAQLRSQIDADVVASDTVHQYKYMMAHVVSSSVNQAENYITIDKGSADGVVAGMGIASTNGAAGIVSLVNDHYSLAISLLNPKMHLSVCIKNSAQFGILEWHGGSLEKATLVDLPRNAKFERGDTIVTTGYAASFPLGVPVGRIVKAIDDDDDQNFLNCEIELFTDLSSLRDIHIISNRMYYEQNETTNSVQ